MDSKFHAYKLHSCMALTLQAYQTRCGELEQELSVLKEELARTGAVAARAAVSEVKGG